MNRFRTPAFEEIDTHYMQNRIPNSLSELVEKTGVIVAGLAEYGATLGLVRHTAASVDQKLTDVITAVAVYTQAKAAQRNSIAALRGLAATARQLAMSVRDHLKPALGNVHSTAWHEVGFAERMAVSFDPAELTMLMLAIKAYFTRYPSTENAQSNFTAARAEVLYNDLTAAVDAMAAAKYSVATALTTRAAATRTLKAAIRGVINELSEEIDPLSEYWLRFGFNKPGAEERPEAPTNVVVVLTNDNAAAVNWDDMPRAKRYRVRKKVNGADSEMVVVGSPSDADFTIEGLPPNSTIEIAISAVNDGGESGLSQVVTIRTQ